MRQKIAQFLKRAQESHQLPFFIALLRKLPQKLLQLTKTTAYWTAVFAIGIVISGSILYIFDVPVVESAGTVSRTITHILSGIVYYLVVAPVGYITLGVVHIFEFVIQYPYGEYWQQTDARNGGFVNVAAVETGWRIVRDVSNIFFSVILVIIALATVLKIERYQWKKMLPTFILVAVLINFSKSIAGIFTDAATVAMATFGGSFSDAFGRALYGAFGVDELLALSDQAPGASAEQAAGLAAVIIGYVAAAGMMTFFFVIIVVFTLILIFRIVFLWFLIVTSPLAYITRVLPQTHSYAERWWKMFGRWVAIGPLITFFMWLTLSIAFGTDASTGATGPVLGAAFDPDQADTLEKLGATQSPTSDSSFQAPTSNVMANFFIMAAMMGASLKLVFGMADEVAGFAGRAQGLAYKGIGLTLGKVGQIGSSLGFSAAGSLRAGSAALGQKNGALNKAGSFGLSTLSSLTSAASFTAAVALQPQAFAKRMVKGYKEQSKAKQKKFRSDLTQRAAELRGSQIAGQGVLGGTKAFFARGAGALLGAGMDDASEVIRNNLPVSLGAMAPKITRAKNFLGNIVGRGDLADMNRLDEEVKRDKLAQGLMGTHNDLNTAAAAGNIGEINLNINEVEDALTQKRDALLEAKERAPQAQQQGIQNEINALNGMLNAGGVQQLDTQDKQNTVNEALNDILAQYQSRTYKDAAGNQQNYVDAQGQFTADAIANLKSETGKRERKAKSIRYKLSAMQPEPGQLATRKRMEAVGKQLDTVKGLSTDEKEAELVAALEKKNWNRVHAVMKALSEEGSLGFRAFRDIMADVDEERAGTGFEGMEAFIEHKLIGNGLNQQQAYAMMNDVIGPESKMNGELVGAFSFDKISGWDYNSPAKRAILQDVTMKAGSITDFSRRMWSVGTADGSTEFSESALKALNSYSKDYVKEPRLMNSISKLNQEFVRDHIEPMMQKFVASTVDEQNRMAEQNAVYNMFKNGNAELYDVIEKIAERA